ncbi:alpha-N-acetylgalactosaminide alpha-2,6-sialyltransferase 5 isoform X3 [Dunckerocampus dactyliophorus]|uniref:alpha-N-acetylgalactosaminide alpha-2,6-sialyltransferase 5 isoform X3 n=1 Tax=Dunckerocampus dactyliophorus TaxID=161453 RepID=UPI0024057A05|nr:alpha-N-acetylgalactosaminide alpha-2,6-sialyltransferase 5 isoform X3 [Dunckerocampus dactyliophorus]
MKTPLRHGVAMLLVLLLCASLFLVYSGSFNGAGRDVNDTRRQEQLWRPTGASVRQAVPHPRTLYGYSGIMDHKPLKMHCQTCALVTSSGHLIGGNRGEEIDRADCVIRMNDAPASGGYASDVGRRTSLRVIAHSSMQRVLRSRQQLINASQDTVFVFWGPSNYMRRDGKGLVYNNLRLMSQVLPKLKVYIISWQKMLHFDELFKRETGKDSRDPEHHSVPYHYYEPRGPDECVMYISHERGRRGSHHRFITEKRVFANWARTFDIHFYQPDWSPTPLPANQSLEGAVMAAPL